MQILQHLINKTNTSTHVLNKSRTVISTILYFNCRTYIPRYLLTRRFVITTR